MPPRQSGLKRPSRSPFNRAVVPWLLFVTGVLLQGCSGFQCITSAVPPPPRIYACVPQHETRPTILPKAPAIETVSAGGLDGTYSVTPTGEASFVLPLTVPPGRAGVQPSITLAYSSGEGDGIAGQGFSVTGASSITRCPKNQAHDGEIRAIQFDDSDKLCLDGRPLVTVSQAGDLTEYRTFPDSFVKVVGHGKADRLPDWFEVFNPNGMITEYGRDLRSRPSGPNHSTLAWLASTTKDRRGNAMTFGYCFAEAGDHTAEYALDEIRYTSFEGSPAVEANRAVKFAYTERPDNQKRLMFAGGAAFQRSLRLAEIQMVGPGEELIRWVDLNYENSPTSGRALLASIEECAADGVCKPATRLTYHQGQLEFVDQPTDLPSPTSRKSSPMLLDVDGDGLDDLVVPDVVPGLSTSTNPITQWKVSHNQNANGLAPFTVAFAQEDLFSSGDGNSDLAFIQPELGTVLDYNQDGRKDILLHDVYQSSTTWQVLLSEPIPQVEPNKAPSFKRMDTGIPRPFGLGLQPTPPTLSSRGGSMHLADVDGDRAVDLIQCTDHSDELTGDPTKPQWKVYRWLPAYGGVPFGFDTEGETIEALSFYRCDVDVRTVDLDNDGKVSLLVLPLQVGADGSEIQGVYYDALTRIENGKWEVIETNLPVVNPGGRVVFLDVNGDGNPDAVESGFSNHGLYTFINQGGTFGGPIDALGNPGYGEQDAFFRFATVLDANGDGRQDLLVPMPAEGVGSTGEIPAWTILQAEGGLQASATFTRHVTAIPFEPLLIDAVTLAEAHAPRIGDLNGDGASDILIWLSGQLHIFQNMTADHDILSTIHNGMNERDPGEEGYIPDVAVSYGHLVDDSITRGADPKSAEVQADLYLSKLDALNDCAYPRRCTVGSRRVVKEYTRSDAAGGERHTTMRYRDGRFHASAGFLGFGQRISTDGETGALTVDFYDNVTFDAGLQVHPFAQWPAKRWRGHPGLKSQPNPAQVEMSFTDWSRVVVPTSNNKTYFSLTSQTRVRRAQGAYTDNGQAPTLLDYAMEVESGSGNATILRDSTAHVLDFDDFGNITSEKMATAGVDLAMVMDRSFDNHPSTWLIGQLTSQKECSTAAMSTQCRAVKRSYTQYGEIESESVSAEDGDPSSQLTVHYDRDGFGNITKTTATDTTGETRTSTTAFDPEGIYPVTMTNAAGHLTSLEFDPRLSIVTRITDPNGLITEHFADGFGRLGREKRPDGTETLFTVARVRVDTPKGEVWRVRERLVVSGGSDHEVERDPIGRVIQFWTFAPTPQGAKEKRLTQRVEYNRLNGQVARRSLTIDENAAESSVFWNVYAHDAVGREVKHTSPWNAVTTTEYTGLTVKSTDAAGHVTTATHDPLGRKVTVTDAANGMVTYQYGPFGRLTGVIGPDGTVTKTTLDSLGRVREVDDPDRGLTIKTYNGFGEMVSLTDALGRVAEFEYDALGRVTQRIDSLDYAQEITRWTFDTAAHGVGKLHTAESFDAKSTYGYDALGRLETQSLAIKGTQETLQGLLGYDAFGRVEKLTYPTRKGEAPFVVSHEFDSHGFVRRVLDRNSDLSYWNLTAVDSAGRVEREDFGNAATTTHRSYFGAKQRLKSITTETAAGLVRSLAYDWDGLLNLKSRTDELQPNNTTERFRYDALDRLTCAYFSPNEDVSAPCAVGYDYALNGNMIAKSDVGALEYSDPTHPHAVTSAGGSVYAYDAVGNQITRPGNVAVAYTPFDLPRKVTQPNGAVSLGYDADQKRVRKSTPNAETLYFADLYERTTTQATGEVVQRFHVRSPERVIAVVTRGGDNPGVTYLHADHLGSVDVITDAQGKVTEKRSYDAFGQRRNPTWGDPTPASFSDSTNIGFTGHESDGEMGLINMKGRAFDPKLGRFLSTDPIVSNALMSQAWNPYSYVLGNPLAWVDRNGWEPSLPVGPDGVVDVYIHGQSIGPPPPPNEDPIVEPRPQDSPVEEPATDVDTTGSEDDSAEPDDDKPWYENDVLQAMSGAFEGAIFGIVPGAGAAEQTALAKGLIYPGPPAYEKGKSAGIVLGGAYLMAASMSGEILGVAASLTGGGAIVGVPAIAISGVGVLGGFANAAAGLNSLMSGPKNGDGQVHHVMTNKNRVSSSNGGPWTPRFEDMAKKAGMTLEDAANKVRVPGHKGPHSQAYHEAVYKRLEQATDGLTGEAYSKAFTSELDAIRTELQTEGSTMQKLLVQK
ncbi:MAG: VCBS repeat-containing protein [Polyangiaceae bacterium]|nr:VCBS repeat-containing protein [Polyangiaceae bacterium]